VFAGETRARHGKRRDRLFTATGYTATLVTVRHAPSQVRMQKHAPSRTLRMAKPRNFSVISAAEDHLYYQSK
jgi:hypothetical protein